MRIVVAIAIVFTGLGASACGDDAPPPNKPGAAAAAAAKKESEKGKLEPRRHVEDQVACAPPPPEKSTGPECKPESATCDPGLYCIGTSAGFHCEACPERDSIRHDFKDRDFVADQVRDPFQSFVIIQPGLVTGNEPKAETTQACKREDQLVAQNYSFQDLKLVGIVAQGTQRKVLMMDSANLGHIIKRGDCVGKEKAVVKDIGTGYITFRVDPDPNERVPRPAAETSVQLHAGGLQVQMPGPESATPLPPSAPVVAPSAPVVAPPNPKKP